MSSWILFLIGLLFFLVGVFAWATALWWRFSHGRTTWTGTMIAVLVIGIILSVIGVILLIWGFIAYMREEEAALIAAIPPRRQVTAIPPPQTLTAEELVGQAHRRALTDKIRLGLLSEEDAPYITTFGKNN